MLKLKHFFYLILLINASIFVAYYYFGDPKRGQTHQTYPSDQDIVPHRKQVGPEQKNNQGGQPSKTTNLVSTNSTVNGTKKGGNKNTNRNSSATRSPNSTNSTRGSNGTASKAANTTTNGTKNSSKSSNNTGSGKGNGTNKASNSSNRTSNTSKSSQKGKTSKSENITVKNIFTELNRYIPLQDNHFNDDPTLKPDYTIPNMGLVNDPNYCLKSDDFNLKNPDNILKNMNFITDYNEDGLPRKLVIKKMGYDVLPDKVSKDMNKSDWNRRLYPIPLNTTLYFIKKVRFYYFHEFNKNMMCQLQMFNHIPGHGSITRKDLNVEMIRGYKKKMKSKPDCYDGKVFFPDSYRLDNETECREFFEYINTDEYKKIREKENVPFVSKISWGSSRGKGLEIVNPQYEKRVRRKYQNGKLCGEIIDNVMMQRYISRPLLLDGHKFDFRIYMLISSTNPLQLFYHDGFLRVSLLQYNEKSTMKAVHLTNTDISKEMFKDPKKYQNLTGFDNEEDMRNFQMWNMTKLQDYLFEKKLIKDKNWLDEYLRPAFKKAFIHLTMMTQHTYLKSSGVYEMFGLDFILDDELNLWFLECNASPVMQGTSAEKEIFQSTLLKDMFNIEYSLLRSRFKRIKALEKEIEQDRSQQPDNFNIANYAEKFRIAEKNLLEPEYTLDPESSFSKIMDLNEQGTGKAFGGFFSDQCFEDF